MKILTFIFVTLFGLIGSINAFASTPLNTQENQLLGAVAEAITAGASASDMWTAGSNYITIAPTKSAKWPKWHADLAVSWDTYISGGGTAALGETDFLAAINEFYIDLIPPTAGNGWTSDTVRARGRGGAF
jgi:hypothetical protein